MPAKRKEEAKSATDIEIDAAYEEMMKGEAAVQNCKDAINDLVTHTVRLKQLESELAPREQELKAVIEKFNRIVESGCVYRKQRGPQVHIAAANSESMRIGGFRASKPSTPRGRSAASVSNPMMGPESPSNSDEKELNKFLLQASKDLMHCALYPLFMLQRTPNELHNAAVLAAKIQEVTVGPQASDATALNASASGKVTPRKKVVSTVAPSVPMSQQPLRPEPALLPPVGIDAGIHSDVLKLREMRIQAEKAIEDLQAQIRLSRDTLQRRKDEGSGTKAALKKAERDLIALTKAHNALKFKKEEEEIIKKREEAAAALKKSEDKKGRK